MIAAATLLALLVILFLSSASVYAADGDVAVSIKANEKIKVEITTTDGSPLPEEPIMEIDKEGEIRIPYNNVPGEYHYTMKQIQEVEGKAYDTTEWKLTLYVYTEDKTYKTTVISYKDGSSYKPAQIFFDNKNPDPPDPNAPDPVLVDPPVSKLVEGDPDKAGRFTFALKAVSNDAGIPVSQMPLPKGGANGEKRVTVKGPGEYEFGVMKITKAGTYVYMITEVDVGEDGYKYDKKRYRVVYTVTESNGKLQAVRHMYDQTGNEVDAVEFVNIYEEPKDPPSRTATGDEVFFLPAVFMLAILSILGMVWARRRRG